MMNFTTHMKHFRESGGVLLILYTSCCLGAGYALWEMVRPIMRRMASRRPFTLEAWENRLTRIGWRLKEASVKNGYRILWVLSIFLLLLSFFYSVSMIAIAGMLYLLSYGGETDEC
ncbi:MAG: hypothetical protein ISS36_02580 [Candidatus Aenigmarchaeota archaeon]|nr:hypothetical protein [Candidatus Aenigmarchaeota archaeon]